MPKMTKAQAKRSLIAIDAKARRLWSTGAIAGYPGWISGSDMMAIQKIVKKNLKRLG